MKKKFSLIRLFILFLSSCLFTSCFQASNSDCNYRTVPVTNNPNNLGSRPSQNGIPY